MAEFAMSPGIKLFYSDVSFVDPWVTPEAVLMLHGNAENHMAWNAWMPYVAREFRVIRPDWRGYGRSTPMPVDHRWSLDELVDDLMGLMRSMEVDRFHIIANRVGGTIAMKLAATAPQHVRTLTVLGSPAMGGETSVGHDPSIPERFEREGMLAWARETMPQRLGTSCSPAMYEGWIQLMGSTPYTTMLGFLRNLTGIDLRPDLPRVTCPTLVVTTNNARGTIKDSPWHALIPRSELVVLSTDSRHPAVTHPEQCARITLDFIQRMREQHTMSSTGEH